MLVVFVVVLVVVVPLLVVVVFCVTVTVVDGAACFGALGAACCFGLGDFAAFGWLAFACLGAAACFGAFGVATDTDPPEPELRGTVTFCDAQYAARARCSPALNSRACTGAHDTEHKYALADAAGGALTAGTAATSSATLGPCPPSKPGAVPASTTTPATTPNEPTNLDQFTMRPARTRTWPVCQQG